eukprot:CAMPEP_0179274692 /NCGR_PEP_ID=MMETSP0797-20121207/33668_1 /TAXON_ID=47934 /ORGANISM="Dinophysis acuminata, Strain DAEP01" /LENGTH=218 /DNA_ID=CAMNT_0020983175 /DNA_START=92 /DNA_END=746 /DNA_ORIENTATION=-
MSVACVDASLQAASPPESDCLLQRSSVRRAAPDGKPVVALTYCDAGFKDIWPTFYKCFMRATSCSGAGLCSMPDVQLMDLGMDGHPEATGQHCTRASLLQVSEQNALTPQRVPPIIVQGISRVLSQGQDVLRLDADAFLLRNPFEIMRDAYPGAHVISSPDCAFDGVYGDKWCGWYREPSYMSAHGGGDPLADLGFMLNTGLMYMRSAPVTLELAKLA